ncbi:MAG: fatty acyl-AMP ligase [Candidatus Rokuibacteriota bacterium]|jgi:fatty-acyl-CoA synthase|nr:MAG: fatty acyl-AMP ligase [Candidatus Rokubacteria bacterium]
MDTTASPTHDTLPLRIGGFASLADALDYAAGGPTGYNFHSGRGELYATLTYAGLRAAALELARRLAGLGLERGARVALVADTNPDFIRFFFACQYAGLVPVPLSASLHLGSQRAYVAQLHQLLASCGAEAAMAPPTFLPYLRQAAEGLSLRFLGEPAAFDDLAASGSELRALGPADTAFLQYTSGTTRFVRGVVVTQSALMNNLTGILQVGLGIRPGDRAVSWLPYYHDMGFVGFVLAPMASQTSVDYLSPTDFAKRPQQWLALISASRATIAFSPTFGYELCARRLRREDVDQLDLRSWRVAGVGAEMIRPEALEQFADQFAPAGFDRRAFMACYGMAECSLAVSFSPLDTGLRVDLIDRRRLAESRVALPVDDTPAHSEVGRFVNCGRPLPGFEVEVRDEEGRVLPARRCGTVFVRGPSVSPGYFADPAATAEVLTPEGWLDTGDLGYHLDGNLVITGRRKDLLIINGRNIWPQDLEFIAEQQPEVNSRAAAAFSVSGPGGEEMAAMVVQCRVADPARRAALVERLQTAILQEIGIRCIIELVPPHTLARTSSGKLSRAGARADFLKRLEGAAPAAACSPPLR